MSLIERAAQKLGAGNRMSLVEKAVAKMSQTDAPPAATPAAPAAVAPNADIMNNDRAPAPSPPEVETSIAPVEAAAGPPDDRMPEAAETADTPTDMAHAETAKSGIDTPANVPATDVPATDMPPADVAAMDVSVTDTPPADAVPVERGGRVTIDLMKLQLAGFITPKSVRTRLLEEFRIIKRPLLNLAFARGDAAVGNGNLIMITSAGPDDGKTFTAINLAMSMASEQDIKVLLVDADGTNQNSEKNAMSVLGLEATKGLLDVLNDPQLDLSDVLIRTNVKNLSLLPGGNAMVNPTELFASNRMGEIIEQLARRYSDRLILIDTPPVLATSEPGVLAMHVGQIVFVVAAERTSKRAVETSLSMISSCQNINLVLNKARLESGADRFGAYSGY